MLLEAALARPVTGRGARGRIPPAPAPDVESPAWAPTDTADWLAIKASIAAAGATAHLWTGAPGSLSASADGAVAVGQGGRVRGIRDHFAPNDVTRRLRVWTNNGADEDEHGGTRVQASGLDMVNLGGETWPGSYPTEPWEGYTMPPTTAQEGHVFWLLDATTSSGEEEVFFQLAVLRVVKSLGNNDIAVRGNGGLRYPMFTGFSGRTFLELQWSLPSTVRWRVADGDWQTITGVVYAARTEYFYGVSNYEPYNFQPAPHKLGAFLYVDRLLPDDELQPFRDHVLSGSGLTDTGPSEPSEPPPASGSNAGLISGITFTRTVNVANASQLTAALAGAAAGDKIVLADGTYAGTFTTSVAGTASSPIAICATNDRVPVINGRIILNHGFNYVYALAFSSSQSDGNVTIDADDCKVLHCNFPSIGARGVKVLRNQRKRFEIAYNAFVGGANPIQILITPGSTQTLNGWCHHNYIKNCSGSSIEMGQNEGHSAVPATMLVEYNLIETSGDNTALGFKCSSNTMHRNTLLNCGNANLQSRHGRNNKFIANACIGTGGCLLRGDGHLAIGNYKDNTFTGSWNDHTSPAGTMRQAEFEQGGLDGTSWPAGDNTLWIGNIPSVRIGGGSSTHTVTALNNRVEASPATLVSGKHSGTTTSSTASQAVPPYIILSSSMVGPGKSPVGPSYAATSPVNAPLLFAQPFNKNSAFNRPIGTGAAYSGVSSTLPSNPTWQQRAAYGAYLLRQQANSKLNVNWSSPFRAATSLMSSSDPLVSVTWTGAQSGLGLPSEPLRITPGFPSDWDVQYANNGNDATTFFIDPDTLLLHDFFQYRPDTKQASIHRAIPLVGTGHGSTTGEKVGTRASGGSKFAGAIRAHELEATGVPIQHAHVMAAPRSAAHQASGSTMILSAEFMWPATSMDGGARLTTDNLGPLPYGTLLAIRPQSAGGPNLSTLGLSEAGLRLAQSIVNYGIYIMDGSVAYAFVADRQWSGSEDLIRNDLRTVFAYIEVVTNSVTGWTGSCVRPANTLQLTGVPGTPVGAGSNPYPAGGGTALAPNAAFDA